MFNTSSVCSSSLSIRSQARVTNSYGSISNQPVTNFFNELQAINSTKEKTQLVDVPREVLNLVADFLGYSATIKSLLPTSSKILMKIVHNEFKMSVQMPMLNGTTLTIEADHYRNVKNLRLITLKEQIENFDPNFKLNLSDYSICFGVFSCFASYMLIVLPSMRAIDSKIQQLGIDSIQSKIITAAILLSITLLFAILSTRISIHLKNPSSDQLKKNIETKPTSKYFRGKKHIDLTESFLVRARLKEELKNHQNFLRLCEKRL